VFANIVKDAGVSADLQASVKSADISSPDKVIDEDLIMCVPSVCKVL
jgi:hypothetical protein